MTIWNANEESARKGVSGEQRGKPAPRRVLGAPVLPAQGAVGSQQVGHATSLSRLAAVVLQLVLLVVVIRELDILPPQYRRLIYLTSIAFLLHHFLPAAWRLRAFMVMSLLGVGFVLGEPAEAWKVWNASTGLANSAVVGGVGLALIGICLLPVGFWLRVGLLGLAAVTIGVFHASSQGTLLERAGYVLAAIFMLRIIIFLYEVSTMPRRPTVREAVTYFFLAPNAAVYSFPVVDYRVFWRAHYNADALAIYQRGVLWMSRGVMHLVIYRWSERAFLIAPEAVQNGTDVTQYLVSNYLTYLQASGTAHLEIGLLLLFGFNLPEAHHRYMFASSFTDFWRRINIYWKDFMQRVFYLPVFFRFRANGHDRALIVATAYVFFVSWVLHLWGTWWLTRHASLTLANTVFWIVIGGLVIVNVLSESRRGRRQPVLSTQRRWRDDAVLLARTAGTFVTVLVLMSLMTNPNARAWLQVWGKVDLRTALSLALVIATVLGAKLAMEILPERGLTSPSPGPLRWAAALMASERTLCVLTLIALYAVAHVSPQSAELSAVSLP